MIEKQNVTLSLPKEVLRKAKLLAVHRDTSLSALLTDALIAMVAEEERYEEAKRSHLETLTQDLDLGTNGQIHWSRESLHDR